MAFYLSLTKKKSESIMSNSPIKLLENFIDYCSVKNQVISRNIANVGTENYRRQDVEFKDLLNDNMNVTLKSTDPEHIGNPEQNEEGGSDFQIVTDNSKDKVSGVNNVNIDQEMSELAANSLNFSFATRRLGDYFKNIQMVIRGGN